MRIPIYFRNLLTIFIFLFLAPLLTTSGVAAITCHRNHNGPRSDDVLKLLYGFMITCRYSPPRLTAERNINCYRLRYNTATLKVCPPMAKEPEFWKGGVTYQCSELIMMYKKIMERCTWDGITRGWEEFGDRRRGFLYIAPTPGPCGFEDCSP